MRLSRLRLTVIGLMVAASLLLLAGYRNATAEAIERRLIVHVADWPHGAAPVRLVLVSDLHVVEPDMPPSRLAAIVGRINALRPDCVLVAGDLISDRLFATRHVAFDDALEPLRGLTPGIATFAVLGNHDHWRNAADARAALIQKHVRVLDNDAARCGALAIGGVDDSYTRHADVARTEAAMRRVGGVGVLVSHGPDVFPEVRRARLTLAGHTHCGQIALPFYGPLLIPSNYGRRYACGMIRERGRLLVVSAGLGTSIVPLRFNSPSDFWVVTVGP